MKKLKTVTYVGVLSILLSLIISCAQVETSSITSSEAINLLQSKNLPLMQGDASVTSDKDLLAISAASTWPDLVVKSISGFPSLPGKIERGSSFSVITKVKNKGNNLAYTQSTLQYYLSVNKSYSSEDILLIGSRTVPTILSKKYSTGSTTVSIPSSTPSGKYYLISCADDKKNIIEKNETNNCKASTKKIEVTNNSVPISIPLNYDTQVTQGSTTDIGFPVNLPEPGNYTNISLNLQDILSNSVTITPGLISSSIIMKFMDMFTSSAEAQSPVTMYMYARIGAFAGTVCQDGLLYGPFLITGTSDSPTVNPPSASAEPSSVNIINSGSFAMCIQVVSQTDASINVGAPSVDVTQCNQPPADISGTWTGTYTCINHGWHNDIDQPITLTITQDGNRAQYDDGEDIYEGTVCGNVFKFNRTYPVEFENESGTFVLNKTGKGTKTSTWTSNFSPDTNWGNCTDHLHKLQ